MGRKLSGRSDSGGDRNAPGRLETVPYGCEAGKASDDGKKLPATTAGSFDVHSTSLWEAYIFFFHFPMEKTMMVITMPMAQENMRLPKRAAGFPWG